MKDKQSAIPKATAKRLSLYYRIFKRFHAEKIERANSKQIAEAIGIDSATVRRDFSYFGELGRRGFGYDVKKLMTFLPICSMITPSPMSCLWVLEIWAMPFSTTASTSVTR